MHRAALEHVLRAAAAVVNEREFVVIGSQSVLGQFPAAPPALLVSMEVDVYPRYAPEKSDILDGAIGELSNFHETFGYYAHGVDETTATLPEGWLDRLVDPRVLDDRVRTLTLDGQRLESVRNRVAALTPQH